MKQGLDYVCLDVALDEKFDLIEAEFGLTGFAVVVKLYQRIYGGEGYYCEWNKEVALLFASKVHVGVNAVSEIVSASIRRGIFDREMFEKHGILTSTGIQKRCFKAVSRRKSFEIDKRYLLVNYANFLKNVDISFKNVNISTENVGTLEHSTVKDSTVQYSKGECCAHAHTRTHTQGGQSPPSNPIPTIEEVREFAKAMKSPVDPKRFWNYYDARDWIMKDGTLVGLKWKSVFMSWESMQNKNKSSADNNGCSGESTFDVMDFFEAALEKTYGKKE